MRSSGGMCGNKYIIAALLISKIIHRPMNILITASVDCAYSDEVKLIMTS